MIVMTKLLDDAIARIRKLPDSLQDEAAELLLAITECDEESVQLSESQIAEIERRLANPAGFVPQDHVRKVLKLLAQ